MDTNCKRCQPLLSALVDNQVSEQENQFIRQHLQTCQDCRAALESYQGIRAQFRKLSLPTPPPELRRAVFAQVRGGAAPTSLRRRTSGVLRPVFGFGSAAIGLAGLAIIVLSAMLIFSFLSRQNPYAVADINATSQGITITFTQDIDQQAIQQKGTELFGATDAQNNPIEYDVQIIDAHTVRLSPKEPLAPGEQVQVEVKQQTPNKDGKQLQQPVKQTKQVAPATPTATIKPKPTNTSTTEAKTTTIIATVTPTVSNTPIITASVTPTVTTVVSGTPTLTSTTTVGSGATPTVPPAATTTIAPPVTTVLVPTTTSTTTTVATTTAATPTDTPTPEPTATATPTSAPTPTATSTPSPSPTPSCTIVAIRGFGKLLSENPDIASRIGCPTTPEANALIAYQSYERGFMLFDSGQIYVVSNSGTWRVFSDTFVTPTPAPTVGAGTPTPPPPPTPNNFGCSITPINGFGKLWRENNSIRDLLGCARATETSSSGAANQGYVNGKMYFNPVDSQGRRIYIFYNGGSYANYPDTFGG